MALIKKVELNIGGDGFVEVEVQDPISESADLGEALDSGGGKGVAEIGGSLLPFTQCKITDIDDIVTYWYASTTSEQTTFDLITNLYEHKGTLIEPTKRLERIYVGAKTLTRPLVGSPKNM